MWEGPVTCTLAALHVTKSSNFLMIREENASCYQLYDSDSQYCSQFGAGRLQHDARHRWFHECCVRVSVHCGDDSVLVEL